MTWRHNNAGKSFLLLFVLFISSSKFIIPLFSSQFHVLMSCRNSLYSTNFLSPLLPLFKFFPLTRIIHCAFIHSLTCNPLSCNDSKQRSFYTSPYFEKFRYQNNCSSLWCYSLICSSHCYLLLLITTSCTLIPSPPFFISSLILQLITFLWNAEKNWSQQRMKKAKKRHSSIFTSDFDLLFVIFSLKNLQIHRCGWMLGWHTHTV